MLDRCQPWDAGGGMETIGVVQWYCHQSVAFPAMTSASRAGGAVPAVGWCTGQVPERGPAYRVAISSAEEAKPVWVLFPLSPVL